MIRRLWIVVVDAWGTFWLRRRWKRLTAHNDGSMTPKEDS